MKLSPLLLALALAPGLSCAAEATDGAAGLRQVLQQYHFAAPPPPRQLTEAERAELRRQLDAARQAAPEQKKRKSKE